MEDLENVIDVFKSGDYARALKLLKPFAYQDNSEAQCIVANIYHLGLGVEKNVVEAIKWYKKSAELGYPVASNNLAGIYLIGDSDVEINPEEAAIWKKLSQDQGFLAD
ncbi:Sel1 repeat family protein [Tumidithrix helvetica PCC 7403]|uniref:tetratricopeptide repeat protein n=1 Tax=Tumidithrix helvetica TaxID=3457545 RepID=UPI003C8BFF4E